MILTSALMGSGLNREEIWKEYIAYNENNNFLAKYRSGNGYLQVSFKFKTRNPNPWLEKSAMTEYSPVYDATVIKFLKTFFVSSPAAESDETKPSAKKKMIGPFLYVFSELRFKRVSDDGVFEALVEICELAMKMDKIHFHNDKFAAAEKFLVNL